MATATKTYKTVDKLVTTTVKEQVPTLTLVLSKAEAEALHKVYRNVGGTRSAGREHVDSVLDALGAAGITSYGRTLRTTGSISFVATAQPGTYDYYADQINLGLSTTNPFKL